MRITNHSFVTEDITYQNNLQHRHTTDKPHIYLEGLCINGEMACLYIGKYQGKSFKRYSGKGKRLVEARKSIPKEYWARRVLEVMPEAITAGTDEASAWLKEAELNWIDGLSIAECDAEGNENLLHDYTRELNIYCGDRRPASSRAKHRVTNGEPLKLLLADGTLHDCQGSYHGAEVSGASQVGINDALLGRKGNPIDGSAWVIVKPYGGGTPFAVIYAEQYDGRGLRKAKKALSDFIARQPKQSRHKGVSFNAGKRCFVALPRRDGKQHHLGYYKNDDVAALAISLFDAGSIEAYQLVKQHGRHAKDAGLLFMSLFQKAA